MFKTNFVVALQDLDIISPGFRNGQNLLYSLLKKMAQFDMWRLQSYYYRHFLLNHIHMEGGWIVCSTNKNKKQDSQKEKKQGPIPTTPIYVPFTNNKQSQYMYGLFLLLVSMNTYFVVKIKTFSCVMYIIYIFTQVAPNECVSWDHGSNHSYPN